MTGKGRRRRSATRRCRLRSRRRHSRSCTRSPPADRRSGRCSRTSTLGAPVRSAPGAPHLPGDHRPMTAAAATAAARFGRAASRVPDLIFRSTSGVLAWAAVAILVLLAALLLANSGEALGKFGISFLTGTTWDPIAGVYGALPFIIGTIASSLIAIVLATPIGLLTAIFLAELAPRRVAIPLTFTIELLAAIPS